MRVLVVYASKYGSTKGIAERIAQTLRAAGHQSAAVPAASPGPPAGYDAYVIGSATYMFSWMHEATDFVHQNAELLATKPVWLFSSGPLGTSTTDAQGRDVLETTVPKQIAELSNLIRPRGHHVFFGAFHSEKLSLAHRLISSMPALKQVMPEGDFRNWNEIDAWARGIASALAPALAV
jgi:menaquinone-dependent protoporphyrinogen oxidase